MQKFKKESEVLVMDSPTSKSRNKVLILIVGLLIVAVVAAYVCTACKVVKGM